MSQHGKPRGRGQRRQDLPSFDTAHAERIAAQKAARKAKRSLDKRSKRRKGHN